MKDRFSLLGVAVLHGVTLSLACVISYWLITSVLSHALSVSREDELLGGMWAVIATIFVYHFSYERSVNAALSRVLATLLSFALCLIYLVLFPFSPWGMATLIGIGAILATLAGRRNDTITTGITTAVVMVVAGISPHNAWKQPVLRLVDTVVGVAVGVTAAWIGLRVSRYRNLSSHPMKREQ
jgi:uncharacterized membrane protein YccC